MSETKTICLNELFGNGNLTLKIGSAELSWTLDEIDGQGSVQVSVQGDGQGSGQGSQGSGQGSGQGSQGSGQGSQGTGQNAGQGCGQGTGGNLPAGTIVHFANKTAPEGYLECDGDVVSRATYPELFAAIGEYFGKGDGETTFGLPDLRGEFLRGWDNGRGVDAGREFGGMQEDTFKSHDHPIATDKPASTDKTNYGIGYDGQDVIIAELGCTTTDVGAIKARGDRETRPRNVALLACIKC